MKIYLAAGFPVMNLTGREAEIRDKFGMNRLFSYAFTCPGTQARVTRSLEVYTGHIYSKKEGESEL